MILKANRGFLGRAPEIALVLVLTGCAQQPPGFEPPVSDLVWPPAPEPPRIRFLYELAEPADVNIRPGWFGRLIGAFRGLQGARVSKPYGLTVDAEGRLYLVDNAYQAVHVFDAANGKYHRFPDEERPAYFINPVSVALGTGGRIYVSDSVGGKVHVFARLGRQYLGSLGGEVLQRPTGLAVNHRTAELLVLDTIASTLLVFVVGTPGDLLGDAPLFHAPTNIAVAANGNVYVSDSLNYRVRILDAELQLTGGFGAAGDVPGSFSRPKGLATDSDGHIYVIDALFDNVQVFNEQGGVLLAFGGPGNVPGKFWLPNAIHIDAKDRIYVSDAYNNRVQVFQYLKAVAAGE
jgi:DNA-binding beta-propeller fold protein YncE